MAKRSGKKKTSSKKKTTRRAAGSGSARGAKKTARRPGRTTAARTTTRKTKKKTRKKATARVVRKKTTKKKTARKTTKKAVARKTPKKKKTAASASRKTASKKKKATTAKAPRTAKVTKKKTRATGATSANGAKTGAAAKKTKTKKKKKRATGRGKTLGARSVAEAASAARADPEGYVFINGRRVRMISTGGLGIVRRTRPSKPSRVAEEDAQASSKPIKTKLSAKELRHYASVLLKKRAELMGDLDAMESAALKSGGGNLSNLPIHMADIGTDTYDQDFMLGLAETERQRLREIDDALRRIQDKTYGVCQMTGKPIPIARLDAKPWAKYTIEAARELEGQWRR